MAPSNAFERRVLEIRIPEFVFGRCDSISKASFPCLLNGQTAIKVAQLRSRELTTFVDCEPGDFPVHGATDVVRAVRPNLKWLIASSLAPGALSPLLNVEETKSEHTQCPH